MSDTTTRSFLYAHQRAEAAAAIARHETSFDETEGVRLSQWKVDGLGALCMMHSYTHRNTWVGGDDGYGTWERRPEPHHLMHFTFDRAGERVAANVTFSEAEARPHSAQLLRKTGWDNWDEVIRVADTLLRAKLEQLRPATTAIMQTEIATVTQLQVSNETAPAQMAYAISA